MCYNNRVKNKIIFLPLILLLLIPLSYAPPKHTTEEVISKFNGHFQKIKNARADITLETSLQIFGCGSTLRQKGYGIFKSPDKIKAVLDLTTYLIKGNFIRRIEPEGKLYHIRLIHAPDFSAGFGPNLIPHNFYLKIIKDSAEEIIIEGTPKPGILKNVKKVYFHFDPKEYLLHELKMTFENKSIKGEAKIRYEKINGLWVPVETFGRSAIEANSGTLIGFNFRLKGKNLKINSGVSEAEFN